MKQITKIIHNDIIQNYDKIIPVTYPIVTSSTYKISNIDNITSEKYTYSRSDNPTRNLLEKNLAKLENGKYGLTFSSGLGVLTCISKLQHAENGIIASHDLYGGTKRFLNNIYNNYVIYVDFNDLNMNELIDFLENNKNKILWIETPSNPLLEIIDLNRIFKYTKQYNILTIVDNTFLSPIFQNPLNLGADIVIHSVTKYINGMSDVVMGCMMTNNIKIYEELKYLQNAMGVIPSPFDCYLVNRSIKTLELRMKRHEFNALKIAKLLENTQNVVKVIYPGLSSYKRTFTLNTQMSGYGGMITFYISGNNTHVRMFLNNLKIISLAESLGGVETLIEQPSTMTHSSIDSKEREKLGISDNMIRLSVGLENYMDIYGDIKQSLNYNTLLINSKL